MTADVAVGSCLADSYMAGLGPALPRQVQLGSPGCCKISTIERISSTEPNAIRAYRARYGVRSGLLRLSY